MAYDLKLARRVREVLGSPRGLSDKEQFGGVAFLAGGNVACGIIGDQLLVRVGPQRHEEAMASKDAKPFSLTGRPSKGWVLVAPSGVRSPANLKKWVEMGLEFAKSLPPK
jgi:hypothetical protein